MNINEESQWRNISGIIVSVWRKLIVKIWKKAIENEKANDQSMWKAWKCNRRKIANDY